MPSLLETLQELFATRDLYVTLGYLEDGKTASQGTLKKAYHKSSLKYHPDRVRGDDLTAEALELATRKFQAIGAVYKILSDEEAKALYDESGEINDENDNLLSSSGERDWAEYWRLHFPRITLKDIADFESKYRYSKEEEDDLKSAYMEGEGDMEHILGTVYCSRMEDDQRFYDKITEWIKDGAVTSFPTFNSQMSKKVKGKRDRKQVKEAKEAEELGKELGLDSKSEDSLCALIKKRQADREQQCDAFFDQLAAKYAKPSKSKKSKK